MIGYTFACVRVKDGSIKSCGRVKDNEISIPFLFFIFSSNFVKQHIYDFVPLSTVILQATP